jgi:Ca-activated chloride channel homolog
MKLKNLAILFTLAVFSAAVFVIRQTDAQTANPKTKTTPTPAKIVKPTPPLPVSMPTVTSTPTPTPTPEEDETIIVDTDLVNLNVRVIDRMNRPINDLKDGDFKVFEDNVPQTLDTIIREEVPINYALVIDNSGSLRSQLEKVIEASKVIVASNKPEDDVCVIRFVNSAKISIEQDFTSNKELVNDALDGLFVEGGSTAVIDAVYLGAKNVSEYEQDKSGTDRKRRALILITDGEDRDSFYKETQLFEALKEADVQIYPIGFVNELSSEGSIIRKSPKDQAKKLLNRMASETGGKAYFPNNVGELNEIAKDIAKSLRTQYLLSYYPTNTNRDGTFRAIKVVVADGKNKEKRIAVTRTGRTAGKDGNAPVLQQQPSVVRKP